MSNDNVDELAKKLLDASNDENKSLRSERESNWKEIESLRTKLAMQAELISESPKFFAVCDFDGEKLMWINKVKELTNATSEEVAKWEATRKAEIDRRVLEELYDFHGETDWYGKIDDMIKERGGVR